MWRPSFTQLDYTRLGGAGFSPHGPRLWIAVGVAAALLLVLWALLLRRKQSGLRLAIGLSALVLIPNTILAGSCLVHMSIVHPVWTVLLMLVPAISLVASFLAIAWVALFWRATQAHECGRCRHAMQESQSICPECGWKRGRPRGVRQARMQAIAICGGLSAFISLLVLRVAIALPITWACWFTADLHTTPHQAVNPMGNGGSTSQPVVPAGKARWPGGRLWQAESLPHDRGPAAGSTSRQEAGGREARAPVACPSPRQGCTGHGWPCSRINISAAAARRSASG